MLAIRKTRVRRRRRGGLLLAGLLSACGSHGTAAGSEAAVNSSASFATVQAQVFNVSCTFSPCHGANSPKEGLNLTAGKAYANLVNVPSVELADRGIAAKRVTPGQPDQSFLIEKLRNPLPRAGDPMPSGQPLDATRIDLVLRWIEEGAQEN